MIDKVKRVTGLDLVRCFAIFFVISVHFFLNNEYYSYVMAGRRMFVMTIMRWLFYTCVPLFMILSGYLLHNKTLEKKYYIKVIRILFEYLIASIICNMFNIVYLHQDMSFGLWIKSIFGFFAAPYSWYVNMYIGLFLMIPFLNLIYNNLKNGGQKKVLILTLLLCTSLPSIININVQLIPNWWVAMYPITYYFIGMYINEFKIKINPLICLSGIALISTVEATITYVYSNGKVYNFVMDGFGGFLTTVLSVLVFLLLYDVSISNHVLKKLIESISKCSLSIYLLSWIFDVIVYKILNEKVASVPEKMPYYFVVVPIVFTLSYIVAFFVNWVYEFLTGLYKSSNIQTKLENHV